MKEKKGPGKACGLDKTKIVLTGQFNSSSNQNYVGTKFSCLKYDLQCTNFEPDKTYNTTMYMRPAKTQVSLCIDPLDKASFLHTVRSAKGLNRLLRSTDVQSQSVQAGPSLRTSFIVGFAMHRLMRELFVQTLTLSTLGTIFSRRHFEVFFSFFQENRICTSCKLSPLDEMSNPVFLVMKRRKKKQKNEFNLSSAELAQRADFEDAFSPMH